MTEQQTPLFDAPRSPALVHVARAARLAHAFHDAACARSGHRFNRTETRAILDLVTRRPVGTMTTLTTTTGNRLVLERTGLSADDENVAIVTLTVVDRDGVLVSEWDGPIPVALEQAIVAAEFRLVRACEVCGSSFRAKRDTATTCSAACRTKRWRARRAS